MCFTSDLDSLKESKDVEPIKTVAEPGVGSKADIAVAVYKEDHHRVARGNVDQCERYRSAVVSAVHDSGIRALCAAGRSCTGAMKCGFCPQGALRPQPLDGFEVYSPAVAQARSYWGVGIRDIPPHALRGGDVTAAVSLGAMLLAAHMQGHGCLTAAFDGVLPVSVPHDIQSLTGVQSWARRLKLKLNADAANRLLAICTIAVFSTSGSRVTTHETVHCFQVPTGVWTPFAEVELPTFTTTSADVVHKHRISMRVHTFAAVMRRADVVVVDRGYTPPVPRECISCASLPPGVVYCTNCFYVVTADQHGDRCAVFDANAMEVMSCRAQLGDTLHQQDVLCFLMRRGVRSAERTIRLTEYKARSAQASFMRLCGYSGPTAVLSSWFEAAYDYFRPYYLYLTFGEHPHWGGKHISTMMPMLDPSVCAVNVQSDYQAAWTHIRKVAVNAELPDDPVVLMYHRVVSGDTSEHVWYMRQYTSL